ncbi:MAG: 30S ribosomal protein S20 [Oscillospiraceae bacterium]|nr:30S ribosomal protein S20 [Oscillospiraceae bacterium]
MPNIKSSAKRDQLSKAAYARNKAERTALKTTLKKFDAAVAEGNKETAVSAYKVAAKAVDKAACKRLIHKNKAANKKSQMASKLNAMAE